MKNSSRTRYQKKQPNRLFTALIWISIVVLIVVLLFNWWQNTQQNMTKTAVQSTQSSHSTSQEQAVSITTETTQEKQKLVIEHGIARVGDIIIVNKKYGLPKEYNPGENQTAKLAFLRLKEDMQKQGFAISDYYSGFRSYTYQEELYNSYVKQDGQTVADRTSARPGHSEHQTGLAFDFVDTTGQLLGEGIQDGATQWLAEHAHEYGFIVRYLEGKEHITGYMAETWHIRYVGDLAEDIYRSGLTLEEYFGVEGGDYAN